MGHCHSGETLLPCNLHEAGVICAAIEDTAITNAQREPKPSF